LHSKVETSFAVKAKVGDFTLLGLPGFSVIVAWGDVPSTITVGWTPERVNGGVRSSISSSVTQVYVPCVDGDVARKPTVSVAPGHSLVGLPPGALSRIFELSMRFPSATHAEAAQSPRAIVVAWTLAGLTLKPGGMPILAR
jgi:hypothetical protein